MASKLLSSCPLLQPRHPAEGGSYRCGRPSIEARTELSGCPLGRAQGPAETGSCSYVASFMTRDDLYSEAEMQVLLVCVHRHRQGGQA